MIIRFNPTATAVQFTGDNEQEVREVVKQSSGKDLQLPLTAGEFYVSFMGMVYTMDDQQFRAAQGLV